MQINVVRLGDLHRRRTSYSQMLPFRPIRFAAVTCISIAMYVHAQTTPHPQAQATLPTTPPTQASAPLPPTPGQQPAQHARVTYANNLLTVSASNSSLNQILREISRQTGIKLTGGVTDERVFGDYGPASSSEVLASLLDGTASNMVIVQSSTSAAPAELILTPRMGGPTPPNPNASRSNDAEPEDQPAPQPEAAQPNPPQSQPQQQTQPTAPPASPANSATPPQNTPETAAPTSPPADSTQQQSPNGVKTPQQIYDELMRLRQQQTKPQ